MFLQICVTRKTVSLLKYKYAAFVFDKSSCPCGKYLCWETGAGLGWFCYFHGFSITFGPQWSLLGINYLLFKSWSCPKMWLKLIKKYHLFQYKLEHLIRAVPRQSSGFHPVSSPGSYGPLWSPLLVHVTLPAPLPLLHGLFHLLSARHTCTHVTCFTRCCLPWGFWHKWTYKLEPALLLSHGTNGIIHFCADMRVSGSRT